MKTLISLIIGITCALSAWAQDAHYWTNQYGTKAALLGGAVVGGIKDNSAVYYNPAALSFIDTASIGLNANLIRMESITLENAIGDQRNMQTRNIGSLPLLVGGRIRVKNPRYSVGYALLNSTNFVFNGTARSEGFYDISSAPDSPGSEEYTGQITIDSELTENLGIAGFSYRIKPEWSVGISGILYARNHTYVSSTMARVFLNDSARTLIAVNEIRRMTYSQISIAPKLGVNYSEGRWSLGATVTFPAMRLMGQGDLLADITANNLDVDGSGRNDLSGSNAQEGLPSHFKYPLRAALGGVYSVNNSRFVFTAEYFGSIGAYSILTPDNTQFFRPEERFPNSTTDQYMRVKSGANALVNLAIGMEQTLSRKLLLSGSFRTDYAAFKADVIDLRGLKPNLSTWDIYHFTAGATFMLGNHDISLGANVGMGADDAYPQRARLDDPQQGDLLQGRLGIAEARYFSLGLILGYSFQFN